ncbi:14370_t:CDS:2 [Entrophospora sp. SA101]|nr:14370_t:CDS:2 [Entrophospora sp. SA101]
MSNSIQSIKLAVKQFAGVGKEPVSTRYQPGDVGWVAISTALVWIMIPGVGFFYSGMARNKNALSLIMLCFLCIPVVSVQNGGAFIGDLRKAFFLNINDNPSPSSEGIPELAFAIYQGMFAAITPALAIGAAAERTLKTSCQQKHDQKPVPMQTTNHYPK